MKKLLLALLLAVPSTAFAVERLDFKDIDFSKFYDIEIPAVSQSEILPESEYDNVVIPFKETKESDYYFNSYILKAVEYLKKNYGLKGYNISAVLTHDIEYGDKGTIKARKPPQTMCVAAAMETILTAINIYAKETGDKTVYDYLPKSSYEKLGAGDIKGHIWVNHDFDAWGTADALKNFGMGQKVKFDQLKPGSFVNINRTTKTGHAVVFINYLTSNGTEQNYYSSNVIGFKYFSSQGGAEVGKGGFDYRYAIFSQHGCPTINSTIKRDCNVIYSENQKYLNTGMMLSPKYWTGQKPDASKYYGLTTQFNWQYFDGKTTDDDL